MFRYDECQIMETGDMEQIAQWADRVGGWSKAFKWARSAVGYGHLAVLELFRDHGMPWDEDLCVDAVEMNRPDVLRYLRENGCVWEDGGRCVLGAAFEYESIEMFAYVLENGFDLASIEDSDIISATVECGQLDYLKLLVNHGVPLPSEITSCAWGVGEAGSVEMLAYLHDVCGLPWNEERTYGVAIRHGRMDCVRYLYQNAGPPDENAVKSAAMQGDMEALRFLVEECGCPCWDGALAVAADNQNLEMLRYLCEEAGCAWGRTTCADAVSCYRSDEEEPGIACLRYLHEHGCPLDVDDATARAVQYGRTRCLAYLREHVAAPLC